MVAEWGSASAWQEQQVERVFALHRECVNKDDQLKQLALSINYRALPDVLCKMKSLHFISGSGGKSVPEKASNGEFAQVVYPTLKIEPSSCLHEAVIFLCFFLHSP